MAFARTSTKILTFAVIGAFAGVCFAPSRVYAQDQSEQEDADAKATPAQAAAALPVGTTICAELTRTLDARKLKVGDPVEARTTLAVLAHGIVAIPEGSKFLGHVTAAAARSDTSERSVVGILFDKVELKGKAEVPISLTLQAIGERPLHALAAPDFAGRLDSGRPPGPPGQRAAPAPPDPPPPPETAAPPDDKGSRNPILDASSKGAYGFPDVFLIESKDATRGSRVVSHKKNVKISDGAEIVLRVIGPPLKRLFLP
jgi:hypothetical protein